MRTRNFLLSLCLSALAYSVSGCSDAAPVTPAPAPTTVPTQTPKGTVVGKHTVPTAPDPNAVTPGP